jgi:hypothetical protein
MGRMVARRANVSFFHHMLRMDPAMARLASGYCLVPFLMAERAGNVAVLASARCQDIYGFLMTCSTVR